jgi:hypothetical protein
VSVKDKRLTWSPGDESWASRLAGNLQFCPSNKEKKQEIYPFEKDKTASHA